ncbi:hypothetical protein QQX98_012826 [Neonectria punicea]|uniref:DUF7580 domain-containing protein n=1 Tax=Neonectria punicea TaxID=979145 RepID=A0ABR1GHS1_9HYPO
MAEVIGVITGLLGLLPVAAQVVSCYRNARTKIAEARACAKELKAIEVDLEVQEGRFLNEWELILRMAIDKNGNLDRQVVRAMIEDPSHPLWKDQQRNDCLLACLARSYHLCGKGRRDHRRDIARYSTWTDQPRLGAIPTSEGGVAEDDFSSTTTKLDRLRNSNQDLEALRSQLYTFQRTQQLAAAPQTLGAPLPQSISRVREVSLEAHKAITETFSCDDASHINHTAALCVNVEVENSASEQLSFDMAISFNSSVGLPAPFNQSSHWTVPRKDGQISKAISEDAQVPPTSQRKGRFNTEVAEEEAEISRIKLTKSSHTAANVDLIRIDNNCNYLRSKFGTLNPLDNVSVFLSSIQKCGYMFHLKESKYERPLDFDGKSLSFSLQNLLKMREVELTLDVQAKMALEIALAVLQFHSTPWLSETWKTSDLFLYGHMPQEPQEPRLFLHSSLSKRCETLEPETGAGQEHTTDPTNSYMFPMADYYGINNMTLFSLAVALLEVGH